MILLPVDVPEVLRRSVNKHCHGRAYAWLLLLLLCVGCASTPAVKPQDGQAPPRQAGPAEQSITEEAVPSQEQEQPALQNSSLSTTSATELPREPITIRKLKQIDTRGSDATPKTARTSDASAKQKIALDFDDADIFEVINALSDILNINYIIDPAVRGKVNIHTTGEIDKSQLLPILDTIFKINNIAAVKSGDLYKIIPIKDTKSAVSDVSIGTDLSAIPATDRVIIQIVPLRYIPSAEAVKVLKPFISPGGDIQEYSKGNILIIVDASANVQKLLSFIDVLDVDTFEQTQVRFFKAKNADVKDLAKELESLFTSLGFAKATDKGIGISFIPVERANCVLAVSSVPGIFEKVEHWVSVLDTVDTGAEAQVFVYYLENAKAEELAGVLGSLYGEGKADTRTGRQPQTPERQRRGESMSSMSSRDRSRSSRSRDREPLSRRKEVGAAGSAGFAGMLQGELTIVTDETTNSLIIKALPVDYVAIKETIQKLDIVP
jgi:general secretion pathway protein D